MDKTCLKHALYAFLLQTLVSGAALAESDARLALQASSPHMAGRIPDGTLLARGKITAQQAHNGFQVWIDAPAGGNRSQRYVLAGKNKADNRLAVRLEGHEWHPDIQGGQGIRTYSRMPVATFSIVTDGDQVVSPDIWSPQVKGGVLE